MDLSELKLVGKLYKTCCSDEMSASSHDDVTLHIDMRKGGVRYMPCHRRWSSMNDYVDRRD
jgi:hypothetical protein